MDIYAELLKDIGVEMNLPKTIIDYQYHESCPDCEKPMEEWANTGEFGCWNCGIMSKMPTYSTNEMEYHQERTSYGKIMPKGNKSQVTYTKRRGYNPLTHFKEHLRRYMGFRYSEDPETKEWKLFPDELKQMIQKDVDLQSPDAYFTTRKVLKKFPKGSKYNKDVFQLIYECGGKRPSLDSKIFEKCVRHFMNFQYRFLRLREEYHRHNLPCYYMILELILRQQGHTPFYEFPHLKDVILKEKIENIFQQVNNKCF